MGFDAAGDEVVAEGDGAAHAVFADVEELGLLATELQDFQYQGEAAAVSVHLGGQTGEAAAAVVLLVAEVVEPFFVEGFGSRGEFHDFWCSFERKGEDTLNDFVPALGDALVDIDVVEFGVRDFLREGEEPAVHEAVLDLAFGEAYEDFRLDAAEDADAGVVDFDGVGPDAVDGDASSGEELGSHLFVGAAAVFVEAVDEADEFVEEDDEASGVGFVLADQDFGGEIAEDVLLVHGHLQLGIAFLEGFEEFCIVEGFLANIALIFLVVFLPDGRQGEIEAAGLVGAPAADDGQVQQGLFFPAGLHLDDGGVAAGEGGYEEEAGRDVVDGKVLVEVGFPDDFLDFLGQHLNGERDAFVVRDAVGDDAALVAAVVEAADSDGTGGLQKFIEFAVGVLRIVFLGTGGEPVKGGAAGFAKAGEGHTDGEPLFVVVQGDALLLPEGDVHLQALIFGNLPGVELFRELFFGFVRQLVDVAAVVAVGMVIDADEAEAGFVATGGVDGVADIGQLAGEGFEVVFVLAPVGGGHGNDAEEAFAADAEAKIPEEGELRKVLLGSLNVFQVVEVQDNEGIVLQDLVFLPDAGKASFDFAGDAACREGGFLEARALGFVGRGADPLNLFPEFAAQLEEFGEGEDLHLVCVAEIAFAAVLDGLIIPSRNGGSVENAHRRFPNGPAVGPDLASICHNML